MIRKDVLMKDWKPGLDDTETNERTKKGKGKESIEAIHVCSRQKFEFEVKSSLTE